MTVEGGAEAESLGAGAAAIACTGEKRLLATVRTARRITCVDAVVMATRGAGRRQACCDERDGEQRNLQLHWLVRTMTRDVHRSMIRLQQTLLGGWLSLTWVSRDASVCVTHTQTTLLYYGSRWQGCNVPNGVRKGKCLADWWLIRKT